MKSIKHTLVLLLMACANSAIGQDSEKSSYDRIWDKVSLYENKDGDILQKLLFTGRLQGDYVNFEDSAAGSLRDFNWRRFRVGFKASIFDGITLHSEADLNLQDPEPLYNRLTDTYLSWVSSNGMKFKVGKQSAPFSLDGSTSSKTLYAMERSKIADNLWFSKEYFSGATISGKRDKWEYIAGLYSSDGGAEFDQAFDAGRFLLFSIGYNFRERFDLENALIRLDHVNNREDPDNGTSKNKNITSLVGKFDDGRRHFWTDLSLSDGYGGQGDLLGLQLMPFYDITDKTQVVFRYTHLKSSDGNGIKLSKYEKTLVSGKGSLVDEYFFGLNHYFYGHKLKWQNGIQYTDMKASGTGGRYDGWGFTSGLRISW